MSPYSSATDDVPSGIADRYSTAYGLYFSLFHFFFFFSFFCFFFFFFWGCFFLFSDCFSFPPFLFPLLSFF